MLKNYEKSDFFLKIPTTHGLWIPKTSNETIKTANITITDFI